ncbi:MAG: DNA polymerase III subunit delta [Christensenellaceae bacterium]|nr:DNA polymerase III subunit delta [Christensenellaceae bacterium]MDD6927469.1 DNA polymerase III subunit delta [bacterium]MDY2851819.1 DNA polymerase III subunit delta [Christensenellaceae bacterium]
MKYSELKRSLTGGVKPVYILSGSDDFLRNYAVGLIKDKCVSMPEINFLSVEEGNFTGDAVNSVINSLNSYPFLSDKRMVVVKEYYPSQEDLKKSGIGAILSNPPDTAVFVISNKKGGKFFDKFDKVEKVDCNSELALCIGWICNAAKKRSIEISPKEAEKIANYSLLDFTKINSELNKLLDYCAEKGRVDDVDIEELVHKDGEYRVYEMTECIAEGKTDEAYAILFDMLSKNENKQMIFVSLYSHFRRMLHISLSNAKDSEIAENLGVKEFAVKMTRRQIRKFSVKRLKNICDKLSEYDIMFKSGETGLDEALMNGIFSAVIL